MDSLRSLPSRKHSCSELQNGNKTLLKVKAEHQDPDEFSAKIKDRQGFFLVGPTVLLHV